MPRSGWLAVVLLLTSPFSYSQFRPDLQARTPDEYDAYLDVLDGPVLDRGAFFERRYPSSSLRLPVCELMTKAYRESGRLDEAIAAADRGLAIAPDYAPLLIELADLLANSSRDLPRAEELARRGLELLQTAKAPLRVAPEDWLRAAGALRARAHSALGLVRFKRDDAPGAVREFQAALAGQTPGDPAVHYRLGKLYALTGRITEARRHLQMAARTGDKALRTLAEAALASL